MSLADYVADRPLLGFFLCVAVASAMVMTVSYYSLPAKPCADDSVAILTADGHTVCLLKSAIKESK